MTSHPQDYSPTARSAFFTSMALLAMLSFYSYYFGFRSQAAGEPESRSSVGASGERQVANIPYFIESNEFHSTLILNNNQTDEKLATVTFFNTEGKRWELAPIRLKPRLIQRFAVSDLLKKAPPDFRSGNIQIVHHGLRFDVMAQITITSEDQRLSFESIRTGAGDFVMSRLDGIYWVPDSETEAKVALTNASPVKLRVTMIAGQKQEQETLGPRETRVLDLRDFVRDAKEQDSATLVTFEHDGPPGALIATGFALNRRTGFSSNLTFADCGTAKSMTLAGAHIRLGPANPNEGFPSGTLFHAPLQVANTMDKPVNVRISIEYTIGAQVGSIRLSPIDLASREVKEVELGEELERRGITGLLDDAGIDISYDGMPGTVIGRLDSYDQTNEYSFDVPIKDPEGGPSNGSYPWRLDAGYSTVLHLKNTLDKEVTAIYRLIYEDGEYNPAPVKLAPQQTIAVDIRKLRDGQEKDLRGAIMPNNVETGKIIWMGLDPQFVIIGRAEVAKVTTGIASSFSCNVCECGSVYSRDTGYLPYLSPNPLTEPVDATGSFMVNEYMKTNCSNDYWGPVGPSGSVTWSSSDTSVATVRGQIITAVGPGSTTITGTWSGDRVAYGFMCSSQYGGGGATAQLTVIKVTNVDPSEMHASTGDAAADHQLSVTFLPSNLSIQLSFVSALLGNPGGSSDCSLTLPVQSGFSPISTTVKATPSGASGAFSVRPWFGTAFPKECIAIVPPQILIQMTRNEARDINSSTVRVLLGYAMKNRFGDSQYFGSQTTYQAAIQAGATYDTSVTTGVQPDLDSASNVFWPTSGGSDPTSGCQGFWSPTSSQWQTVQQALNSATTTLPNNIGLPFNYGGHPELTQVVYFPSAGMSNTQNAPAFLFVRKRTATDPAVVQLN
jgi:hypothetical protein